MPDANRLDPATLLKLYETALAEYRFQVQLNWDRTKHYFVFNGALLAAAGALFKVGEFPVVHVIVGCLLSLACLNALAGVTAIRKGHEYYERDRARVAAIEKLLTLDQPQGGPEGPILAMTKTAGMREEHGQGEFKRGRLSTITSQAVALQWVMAIFALGGAVAAGLHALHVI